MLPERRIRQRLWGYLRPYWRLQVVVFICMMALAGLALAIPAAVKYMIDNLIPRLAATAGTAIDWRPAARFGILLVSIYFLRILFALAQDYISTHIGASIMRDLRAEFFGHLSRVSFAFYRRSQVGEITSRALADINQVQHLLAVTLLMLTQNVLLLVGILVFLLTVNWKMTLIAIVPVPLTIWLSHMFGVRAHRLSRALQETIARLHARLQETLSGQRTIRAFGMEKAERAKVVQVMEDLKVYYIKTSVLASLSGNVIQFVNMLGPVVVLAWGTYLIAGGSLQLGALMAFYMLLTYLYEPVQGLASINVQIQSAMASVFRVFEYLDLPLAIAEDPSPVTLTRVRGAIRFENVSYRYDDSGFGLEDFSLAIEPGETVAIVGPSGAGKTTIVNLLMRFFDPDAGRITLDGVDLRRLALISLRENVSLVDQDPVLFKMSVFDNIAYADPGATAESVERAARIANIHDFIAGLKEGYRTDIGERGVSVSGGERQRICLARAVLRDPPVILLDEATSSLDSKSEELIQHALKTLLAEKTAVIVAHRLATILHADRIIVVDRGRFVAQGTHASLLESSSLYRELAEKQFLV